MAEPIEKAEASSDQVDPDSQESPRVRYTLGYTINPLSHTAGAKSSRMRPMHKTHPRKSSPHEAFTDAWNDRLVALQHIIHEPAAQVEQSQIEDQSRFAVPPLFDALPSIVPTPLSSSVRRPRFPLQRAFVFAEKEATTKPTLPYTHSSFPLHPSEVLSITEARFFVEDQDSDVLLAATDLAHNIRLEAFGISATAFEANFLEARRAQELTVGMLWEKTEVRQILEKTGPVWVALRILGLGYHGLRFKDGVGRELWRIEKVLKRFVECRSVVKKSDGKGERAQSFGTKTVAGELEPENQLPAQEGQNMIDDEATQSKVDITAVSLGEEPSVGASQTEEAGGDIITQSEVPACAASAAKIHAPEDESEGHHAAPEAEVDSSSSSDSEDGGVDLT
ncbi:hypothetical protein TI39_contig378g00018 [Zymoseptoria brevis]|uniref:Uncharacterized protein n=1 Tax=Zymoseptoria brevis TaxID=1047168 RepID=A0A0F4GP70_9PEZI|nr:hypothetical protein TI39_contig378g00018 [Zymoseptoria brevis]